METINPTRCDRTMQGGSRVERNHPRYDRPTPGGVRIILRQAFREDTDQICLEHRDYSRHLALVCLSGLALQLSRQQLFNALRPHNPGCPAIFRYSQGGPVTLR